MTSSGASHQSVMTGMFTIRMIQPEPQLLQGVPDLSFYENKKVEQQYSKTKCHICNLIINDDVILKHIVDHNNLKKSKI